MGFLNGRVTFTRYRVSGSSPLPFADDLLAMAVQHAAGRHGSAEPWRPATCCTARASRSSAKGRGDDPLT